MKEFEILFGMKESQIKKTCILLPLFSKAILSNFNTKEVSRGRLYTCAGSKNFTLIRTGAGAGFTGDAVLYLKNTPCRNVILFGSCGLAKEKTGLALGSLAAAKEAHSFESFSELLSGPANLPTGIYPADKILYNKLLAFDKTANIHAAACATFGSLKLEKDNLNLLEEKGIDIIDMECSAFYAAAAHIKRRAAAIFYISDIVGRKDFYASLTKKDSSAVAAGITKAAYLLHEFAVYLEGLRASE